MTDTWFREPTGLEDENTATVNDLIKLMKYVFKERPEFTYLSRQKETAVVDLISGEEKFYESINKFAGRPDFIGGKTGYTEAAGENLVSLFKKEEKVILVIVLGAEDRFLETEILLKWAEENELI